MGELFPKRSSISTGGAERITVEELEQYQWIVKEANNPASSFTIPSDIVRHAQLQLARFEHQRYLMVLKQHPDTEERKKAMDSVNGLQELIGKPLAQQARPYK